MISNVLTREPELTKQANQHAKLPYPAKILSKPVERQKIRKANEIVMADGVHFTAEWDKTGWLLVKSLKNMDATAQSSNEGGSQTGQSNIEKSVNILANLTDAATNIFRTEITNLLPDLPINISNYDMCNIHLCICTCAHFIQTGQPYFCKHLYAAFIVIKNITDPNKLLNIYLEAIPCIPDIIKINYLATGHNIMFSNHQHAIYHHVIVPFH